MASLAPAAVPEAALQSEPADPGPAHPRGAESAQRRASRAARRPALRSHPQPRGGADADGCRGEEPEDAPRVDGEPARFRRAAGPRARTGPAVPRRRPPPPATPAPAATATA